MEQLEDDKSKSISADLISQVVSGLKDQIGQQQPENLLLRYVKINNTIVCINNLSGIRADDSNGKFTIKFDSSSEKHYTFTWENKEQRDSEFNDLFEWLWNTNARAIILEGAIQNEKRV